MRHAWKDEDITKVLGIMSKASTENVVFDRVWFKIEKRLSPGAGQWRHSFVWRPWVHPVRWVAAVACLALVFSGAFYKQYQWSNEDRADLVCYMLSVSNPTANDANESDVIKVSTLMLETSNTATQDAFLDGDRNDSLTNNGLFL